MMNEEENNQMAKNLWGISDLLILQKCQLWNPLQLQMNTWNHSCWSLPNNYIYYGWFNIFREMRKRIRDVDHQEKVSFKDQITSKGTNCFCEMEKNEYSFQIKFNYHRQTYVKLFLCYAEFSFWQSSSSVMNCSFHFHFCFLWQLPNCGISVWCSVMIKSITLIEYNQLDISINPSCSST